MSLLFTVQYETDFPELSRQQLRAWALRAVKKALHYIAFERAELNLRFVDQKEAIALNQHYRHKHYAPNVLTFEYGIDEYGVVRSDIIICPDILKEEAQQQKKTVKQHAAHLVVHGVLHALGYDHLDEQEAQEMENLEASILAEIGFPNPY